MREPSEVVIGDTTLDKIIENHNHWLNQDCENWESMRADLSNVVLLNVDLQGVNLSYANLENADLEQVNLMNANLSNATLRNAYLEQVFLSNANLHLVNLKNAILNYVWLDRADLSNANLSNANLRGTYLRKAILEYSNLCNANLEFADLTSANLKHANLYCTNFKSAKLIYADLKYTNIQCTIFANADLNNADMEFSNIEDTANFYEANLHKVKFMPYIPMACPSDGEFIGWKKAREHLIKLKIPASAKRSSAGSFKCRASKAKVLGIYTLDGKKTDLKSIDSNFGIYYTKYIVGEYVYPDSFDENRWNECSHGIHFFINKQDAINY